MVTLAQRSQNLVQVEANDFLGEFDRRYFSNGHVLIEGSQLDPEELCTPLSVRQLLRNYTFHNYLNNPHERTCQLILACSIHTWYGNPAMRPSLQKHTLAKLRVLVGLGQKELADLLGRATTSIQKIEAGQLPLGAELAGQIALKTGINLKWLIEDKVSRPPIDSYGKPYTRATFDETRAFMNSGYPAPVLDFQIWSQYSRFTSIIWSALDKDRFMLFDYKVNRALAALEKEFGHEPMVEKTAWNTGAGSGRSCRDSSCAAVRLIFDAADHIAKLKESQASKSSRDRQSAGTRKPGRRKTQP